MRRISKCIFHSIIFRLHTKTRFAHVLQIIFTTSPSANLWAYPALLGDSKHPGWPPPPHLAVSPNSSGPAQENLTSHYKMQVHHRKIYFSNVAGLTIISWVKHEQRKMLFLVDEFPSTCGWTHAKASTTLASPSILAIKVLLTKAYFSPVTWWQTNSILMFNCNIKWKKYLDTIMGRMLNHIREIIWKPELIFRRNTIYGSFSPGRGK